MMMAKTGIKSVAWREVEVLEILADRINRTWLYLDIGSELKVGESMNKVLAYATVYVVFRIGNSEDIRLERRL